MHTFSEGTLILSCYHSALIQESLQIIPLYMSFIGSYRSATENFYNLLASGLILFRKCRSSFLSVNRVVASTVQEITGENGR